MSRYAGYIDVLTRFGVAGWAANGADSTRITISIDDKPVAKIVPEDVRDDVAALGFAQRSGFKFDFAEVVDEDSVVSLTFEDGSHLGRSPNHDHSLRFRNLTDGLSSAELGLEIGALDRPTLLKSKWNVRYVDHASKEDLIEKYGDRPSDIDQSKLMDIDLIWDGSRRLSEVTRSKFDYCLASHVIEHVPDIVSWLADISEVLKVGGKLNLAVPEKTRTFDVRRELTGAADLVDNYFRRLRRPSPKHIFDHLVYTARDELLGRKAGEAIRFIEAMKDVYVDVHCHVFTAKSFLKNMSVLAHAGLLDLSLRRSFPMIEGSNEFFVSMQKLEASASEIADSYDRALADVSQSD